MHHLLALYVHEHLINHFQHSVYLQGYFILIHKENNRCRKSLWSARVSILQSLNKSGMNVKNQGVCMEVFRQGTCGDGGAQLDRSGVGN